MNQEIQQDAKAVMYGSTLMAASLTIQLSQDEPLLSHFQKLLFQSHLWHYFFLGHGSIKPKS